MGREVTIIQGSSKKPDEPAALTLEQVAKALTRMATNERYRCLCGVVAASHADHAMHRQSCQLLRCAIVGDILRVADHLKRTPTVKDYIALHNPLLPSWSVLSVDIFDSWEDALTEAHLVPNRKSNSCTYQ